MLKNLERTKRIWVKISEFRKSLCASLNPCKQFSVSIEGGGWKRFWNEQVGFEFRVKSESAINSESFDVESCDGMICCKMKWVGTVIGGTKQEVG